MDTEITITKGQLRAFMYENYAKGKADIADAIIAAIENKRTEFAGLAGIGNAVLLEEMLIEIVKDSK